MRGRRGAASAARHALRLASGIAWTFRVISDLRIVRCLQQGMTLLLNELLELLEHSIGTDAAKTLLFQAAAKLEIEKKKINRQNSIISGLDLTSDPPPALDQLPTDQLPLNEVAASSPQFNSTSTSNMELVSNREASSISNIPLL